MFSNSHFQKKKLNPYLQKEATLQCYTKRKPRLEHSKNTERERLFLVYAKQWWKEYLEIRDDHKNRLVKIFAQVIFFFFRQKKF